MGTETTQNVARSSPDRIACRPSPMADTPGTCSYKIPPASEGAWIVENSKGHLRTPITRGR